MNWHKFLTFVLLFPISSLATITFERTYSTGTAGYIVKDTPNGDYTVLGCYGAYTTYFMKTDSLGDTLWTRRYNFIAYTSEISYSFEILSDEGFIIVGYIASTQFPLPCDIRLLRIDSVGDTVWTRLIGGDSLDKGYWIEITPDTNFIIVGETKSYGAGNSDVWLIKTDTLSNILWSKTYGGTSYDMGRCVKNTPDKGFIIVGSTYSFGAGFRDIYLIKTDSLGNLLWQKTYGGSNYEYGYDVEITSDNGYIIIGQTNSFGVWGQDVYLIRTDSLGDTLWTKTFGNGVDDDVGYSVALAQDNDFVIAGYTTPQGGGKSDVWLIKTDSLGNVLWTRTYGSVDDDCAYSIKNTLDNGFIIAGSTSSGVYLIKTDSLGNVGIEEKEISDFAYQVPVLRIFPSLVTESFNIKYVITHTGATEISLYDVTGARVKNLIKENVLPGYYQEKIDTKNFASGIYFIVLRQDNEKVSKKFLLIK